MAAFNPFEHPEHIKLTGRARELEQLRRVYEGRQYEGRADWWTGVKQGQRDGDRVPLRDRKPCIIYRLPKAGVEQIVRFLFGDGRFPAIRVPVVEAENALKGAAISEDAAEKLQNWITEFVERAEIKPRQRALAEVAIARRTSVAVVSLRDGQFRFDMPQPEHCWALFRNDDPADEVTALVWCYEYTAEVAGKNGEPETKQFLFRRQWDAKYHHVWEDVEVEPGKPIKWGQVTSTEHGSGCCPVVWMRNVCEHANGMDGLSLFEETIPELEALDFTLSQRHRGLAYLGTPQPYEIGVAHDDGPGQTGRTSNQETPGYSPANGNDGTKYNVATAARRMAPDEIWSYEGKEVNVDLLETSGEAFKVASAHVTDIRSRILETWGVVLMSMTDTVSQSADRPADMSARFLAFAYAPLLALVNEYRHTWWPHGLCKLITMALRIVAELGGKGILIPGSKEVASILAPFLEVDIGGGQKRWMAPKLEPAWGDFFDPSPAEVSAMTDAATKAHEGRFISVNTGSQYVAPAFDVEDVNKEREAIEDEAEEARKKAQEDMSAEARALHEAARASGDRDQGGGGPKAGGKPPRVSSSGSSAAAPAAAKSKQGAAQPATDGR